jgi:uracil-DNA glycosylase family 4
MSSNNSIDSIISIMEDYQIKETTISTSIFNDEKNDIFKIQTNASQATKVEKIQQPIQKEIKAEEPKKEYKEQIPKITPQAQQQKQVKKEPIKVKTENEIMVETIKNDVKNIKSISDLHEYIKNSDFSEVKKISNNTVIGQGIENANILLIGEAPGEEEDKNGIPFCGRSGRLLDNILKSINLSRDLNLYITNSFFWRPPANRKPTNEEISTCRPIVQKIIELISPKLIILCGSTAIESIMENKNLKISDARSTFEKIKIGSIDVNYTSIYHPSYLLRNPSAKKIAWQDIMSIKNFISQNNILIS